MSQPVDINALIGMQQGSRRPLIRSRSITMLYATEERPPEARYASAVAAVALFAPCLLAFNLPPSPTLLNQGLAIGLWGLFVCSLSCSGTERTSMAGWRVTGALDLPLLVLAVVVVVTWLSGSLPRTIGLSSVLVLACAATVVRAPGCALWRNGDQVSLFAWFLCGLTLAGLVSACVAFIQVFAPHWSDGELIARSGMPGRAVGNLRQPNHLSSLVLWALIAVVGLVELLRLNRMLAVAAMAPLVLALVLSGSRTGALGTLLLAAWGLRDRRLSRVSRALLLASPLLFVLCWAGLSAWAHTGGPAFGGEGRLTASSGGDISSSRFAIWSNALTMIAREPLLGVGYGEFNLAWTLSEFPDRPVAFFDHSHNLALQLAVELGLPLAALLLGLLLTALVQAWRRAWAAPGDDGIVRRAAFMIVLMIGLHSQLEYPLWYAYFLLPTAFAWGFALAAPNASRAVAMPPDIARRFRPMAALGVAMAVGAVAAVLDYWQVVVIYAPPTEAAPLEERITRGQRSPLFSHHADYAAATAFGEPKAPLSPSQQLAFQRAPHQLLDIRLMIAWAQALAVQGELDKARWLVARIREFRNPGSDEFFQPCAMPAEAAQAFQCQAPQRAYHWREFVAR